MRLVPFIIAILLAAAAAFIALKFLGGSEPAPKEIVVTPGQPDVKSVNVVVAARKIALGERITADMLEPQPWPEHLVVEGFIKTGGDTSRLVGMVARSSFQNGEPLIMAKLANPSDPNFLAADLPKDRRVATISTDGIAGIAGFLFPGDRVDVMVTHKIPKEEVEEKGEKDETVTETLLTNIKIVAVDQRSEPDPDGKIKPPASVSLEVSLDDAQRMRLAQEVGTLSLALRSIDDKDTIDTTGITRVRDLSQTDTYDHQGRSATVTVIRGTKLTKTAVNSASDQDGNKHEARGGD